MYLSRKMCLSIPLASLLFYSALGQTATGKPLKKHHHPLQTSEAVAAAINDNKSFFYISFLYVQPNSNNLAYGTFVSGMQPYHQSWHYLSVNPDYHPDVELGFNYALKNTADSAAVYWTHINTNDSSNKQASRNTDLSTVEFVAPPFEMSPPVFGIKHVDSKANFAFDNVLLNFSRLVEYGPRLQARFFGGLSIVNLNQTVTTTFSDYAGSPATAYSYSTPPDPSFSFQLKNVSKYIGAGPDVGLSMEYQMDSGFGFLGQVLGVLTAGLISTQDDFTSTSSRLTANGIGISHQEITAPNATQVVFGADSKVGIFYKYQGLHLSNITIEAGYRIAAYLNAISTVNPNTLVQPGTVTATPEFATGTMAIVSTDARTRPFTFNGPFLDVKIDIT